MIAVRHSAAGNAAMMAHVSGLRVENVAIEAAVATAASVVNAQLKTILTISQLAKARKSPADQMAKKSAARRRSLATNSALYKSGEMPRSHLK